MGVIGKNTRYCQFTESQAGDGKAGYITYDGGQRIAEKGRTAEICKTGRDSGSEGYLPIFEHNRGFSQKIHLFASTSGRDGAFAWI